jgi:L-rhamnose mutarotase
MNVKPRFQAIAEIALIFAAFAVQGAWPVPEMNEPYYVGKAIHYWNQDSLRGDFFMESADVQTVFYFTFGWLSLWLSPTTLIWTGRLVGWFLLAWAWRRLSMAVIPRPWFSVLTGALFGCLMERCHMAGEWIIGGIESKVFAYVLVLFGLESLLRNRWNRALWLFGAAASFHVLVGGWSIVAAALAWSLIRRCQASVVLPANYAISQPNQEPDRCPSLLAILPGVFGAILLALPGLIPALRLDWGVDPETLRQSHQIYVFERLSHHLVLSGMRSDFIRRMALLGVIWLALGQLTPAGATLRRLRAFVAGAVVIACVGAALHSLIFVDRAFAAGLLRYYWFRLLDVAMPLGVSMEIAVLIATRMAGVSCASAGAGTAAGLPSSEESPVGPSACGAGPVRSVCRRGRWWLALALLAIGIHLGDYVKDRWSYVRDPWSSPPRSFVPTNADAYKAWREACDWIVSSGQIPEHATFITPRRSQTFKWYTGRNEVATWKDVPQDATTLLEWWTRIQDIYATRQTLPNPPWHESMAEVGAERLRELGAKYHADYVITDVTDPLLSLPEVYHNSLYVIYRLQ